MHMCKSKFLNIRNVHKAANCRKLQDLFSTMLITLKSIYVEDNKRSPGRHGQVAFDTNTCFGATFTNSPMISEQCMQVEYKGS
jgi:hypothetical protein